MTAYFKKRELRMAQEGSFMENASSLGSITWTVSSTVLRPKVWDIDTSGLKLEDQADQATLTDLRQRLPKVPTVTSGSKLTFKHYLTGLGTAGTGSITTTELGTMLSWSLGNESKASGTTVTGSGSTTTTVDCTSAAGIAVGQFVIVNKEMRRVTDKSSNTITVHHALSGAPSAADVVYACSAYYPTESAPSSSLRFAVFGDTGNAADQIICVGCALSDLKLMDLEAGKVPYLQFEYAVSYWSLAAYSLTFTTTAFLDKTQAVNSGGGMFFNQAGTTTRNSIQGAGFKFDPMIPVVKDPAIAGISNIGDIQNWTRSDCSGKGSLTTAFATTYRDLWASTPTTAFNILYQLGPTAGKACGLYIPTAYADGEPKRTGIGDKTGWEFPFFCARGADTALTTDLGYAPFHVVLG